MNNNEPPVHIQVKALYDRWIDSLQEYQAVRVSPGSDKRHLQIHLDCISELYAEAQVLKHKKLDGMSKSYISMILSRPVHEHMILAQGRHQVVG